MKLHPKAPSSEFAVTVLNAIRGQEYGGNFPLVCYVFIYVAASVFQQLPFPLLLEC